MQEIDKKVFMNKKTDSDWSGSVGKILKSRK
jgi:hypothetical protein